MKNSITYQLGIYRLDMNEDNKGWGVTVTNYHQRDEVTKWVNAVPDMLSTILLIQIVEGTGVISSDTLCTTALIHLQETRTGVDKETGG